MFTFIFRDSTSWVSALNGTPSLVLLMNHVPLRYIRIIRHGYG